MTLFQVDLECTKCGWMWRAYAKVKAPSVAVCEKCRMISALHKVLRTCSFEYERNLIPTNIQVKLIARYALNRDELSVPVETREMNLINPLTGEFSKEMVDVPVPNGTYVAIDPQFPPAIQPMAVKPPPNYDDMAALMKPQTLNWGAKADPQNFNPIPFTSFPGPGPAPESIRRDLALYEQLLAADTPVSREMAVDPATRARILKLLGMNPNAATPEPEPPPVKDPAERVPRKFEFD